MAFKFLNGYTAAIRRRTDTGRRERFATASRTPALKIQAIGRGRNVYGRLDFDRYLNEVNGFSIAGYRKIE